MKHGFSTRPHLATRESCQHTPRDALKYCLVALQHGSVDQGMFQHFIQLLYRQPGQHALAEARGGLGWHCSPAQESDISICGINNSGSFHMSGMFRLSYPNAGASR